MRAFKIISLLSLILVVGCQNIPAQVPPTQVPVTTDVRDQNASLADNQVSMSTPTPFIPSTTVPSPTITTTYTATPDTRPLPEDWMEWPVVPEPTSRVYEIYQKGIELGNDPHQFSKIGDCQNVREAFMGLFDKPGWYILRDENANLQPVIDWFAGSFDRDGSAVKGGFNAASVLNPIWADQSICEPNESPVECELRVHNPIFAFVSMELWWNGRTTERYEEYMRQILDTLIENGVVPILATKADNVEGDHALNLTTAKLAYEYNLPLWNFWAEAQTLPNKGMDPQRNDGFHISYQAWTVRSFSALRTLDVMWRSVQDLNN